MQPSPYTIVSNNRIQAIGKFGNKLPGKRLFSGINYFIIADFTKGTVGNISTNRIVEKRYLLGNDGNVLP